jgi:hypothetical protein
MSYIHQHPVTHAGRLYLFQADQTTGDYGVVGGFTDHYTPAPLCIRGAVSPSGVQWLTFVYDGPPGTNTSYASVVNATKPDIYSSFPRTFGAGSIALRMDGEAPELYLMKEGDGSTVYVYDLDGEELRKYQRSPASQRPLWKILDDGTPLLSTDPERRFVHVEPDGLAFYNWDRAGDYICGGSDGWNGERNAPCIVVRNTATGETRCFWYETAELPWIVMLPDGPRLVLSGENPPAPLTWDELAPYAPVRSAPPAPVDQPKPPVVTPPAPADCKAEREQIDALAANLEASLLESSDLRKEAREMRADVLNLETELARTVTEVHKRLTPEQVLKLVNDATGQMAGYWRYLGVQGAVDKAIKAELAKR